MSTQVDITKFEVVKKIGQGGFGKVYQIKEKLTGIIYACKVSILTIDDLSEEALGYILREINIISKLTHPSILKFVGYSPTFLKNKKNPCMLTEYLSNGTLKDILNLEKKGLCKDNWNDTRKLINIYGIASAMSFLHLHEIIHRDLKPENILMDEFLLPKISDFGLSKIKHFNHESVTLESGTGLKGTPLYIAPEIWTKFQYSKASDVYAFGMIVYEIITNSEPFSGCSFFDILRNVQNCKRPETDGIPESYKNLIEICWDQNPSNRPTFSQIVRELKKDSGFITEMVEEVDFENYVNYIDSCQQSFNNNQRILKIDKFITRETEMFKKVTIDEKLIVKQRKQMEDEEMEKSEVDVEVNIKYKKKDDDLPFKFPKTNDRSVEKPRNLLRLKLKDASPKSIPSILFHYATFMMTGTVFPVNLKESADFYKISADLGYAKAMTIYGELLLAGHGVEMDEREGVRYYKMAIEKGESKAMFAYASLLDQGDIIKQNYEKALTFYKMAAENGNIESLNSIGLMHLEGRGTEINYKKALRYFERAAEEGDKHAYNNLALMYNKGLGVEVDAAKSFKYEKKSADLGYDKAMYNIGYMYEKGIGVDIDYQRALEYYTNAANCGHATAFNNIGFLYIFGQGVNKDLKEGFKYIHTAATKGSFEGMRNMANLYGQGIGCDLNYKKAFYWIRKAVENGDKQSVGILKSILDSNNYGDDLKDDMIEYIHQEAKNDNEYAMLVYGIIILEDRLIPRDFKRVFYYLKSAADAGLIDAMIAYANLMKGGLKGDDGYEEAFEYFKMAADKNDPRGFYNLGIMYRDGIGVTSNPRKAQQYFQKADELGYQEKEANNNLMNNSSKEIDDLFEYCQQHYTEENADQNKIEQAFIYIKNKADSGDPNAMTKIGKMYEDGIGTKVDYKKAFEYYKLGVDNGDEISMNNIGFMYLKGIGVQVNSKKAIQYFQMAAEKGSTIAMQNLGIIYENGNGVDANYEKALEYHRMRFEHGDNEAIDKFGYFIMKYNIRSELKAELIELIQHKADSDDPLAMFVYGILLTQGKNVPKNAEKGLHYLQLAVDKNYTRAIILYGDYFRNGNCLLMNADKAFKYYKKAYELGDTKGMKIIGEMLANKEFPNFNEEKIKFIKDSAFTGEMEALQTYKILVKNDRTLLSELKKEAERGNVEAMRTYGYVISDDDLESSKKFLLSAAEKGDEKAQKLYDDINENCITFSVDHLLKQFNLTPDNNAGIADGGGNFEFHSSNQQLNQLKILANHGDSKTKFIYACSVDNLSTDENKCKETAHYFKLAANEGHVQSMFYYARCLYFGIGVDINYKESFRYFKMAADQGYIDAMSICAFMLDKGIGVQLNVNQAFQLYQTALQNSNFRAINNISVKCFQALKNDKLSNSLITLLRVTAENCKCPIPKFNLAYMYQNGISTTVNKNEACKFYKLAADSGDVNAMISYARMVENGIGCTKNVEEANRYYQMSNDKSLINKSIEMNLISFMDYIAPVKYSVNVNRSVGGGNIVYPGKQLDDGELSISTGSNVDNQDRKKKPYICRCCVCCSIIWGIFCIGLIALILYVSVIIAMN